MKVNYIQNIKEHGKILFLLLYLFSMPALSQEVIYENNFDNGAVPNSGLANFTAETSSGATLQVSSNKTLNYNGSNGSLKGNYPTAAGTGGYYIYGTVNLPRRDITELFIEFKAKLPGHKQGFKFLKIFGQYTPTNGYANTTFGLEYDSGEMHAVSFGSGDLDGAELTENDTHNVIFFSGDLLNWSGRSANTSKILTPQKKAWTQSDWGDEWHHFRFHLKFNSGTSKSTEKADGEYYVEIDGKVYADARGVFNRHHLNLPIDRLELFGWSQSGTGPFEIWYDDFRITTGNFVGNPKIIAPKPPIANIQ